MKTRRVGFLLNGWTDLDEILHTSRGSIGLQDSERDIRAQVSRLGENRKKRFDLAIKLSGYSL